MEQYKKKCRKCKEVKDSSNFRKDMSYKDGLDSRCKDCRKQEYKEKGISPQKKYYEKNKRKILDHQKGYRSERAEYYSLYMKDYLEENSERELERRRIYRENNKEKFNEHQKKRRYLQITLDSLHPELNWDEYITLFDERCAISDVHDDVTIDHFIPVGWGHGGTYIGNIYPLNLKLNKKKNNLNPFTWFERMKDRLMMEQNKWDNLVKKLAELHRLTVDEFREFVYWCENNKRSTDDIKSNPITSLELWRISNDKENKV